MLPQSRLLTQIAAPAPMTHSCVAPRANLVIAPTHSLQRVQLFARQLILNASGAEAAGQGVQKSRQREEMQRAIRDSGQRHHEL